MTRSVETTASTPARAGVPPGCSLEKYSARSPRSGPIAALLAYSSSARPMAAASSVEGRTVKRTLFRLISNISEHEVHPLSQVSWREGLAEKFDRPRQFGQGNEIWRMAGHDDHPHIALRARQCRGELDPAHAWHCDIG